MSWNRCRVEIFIFVIKQRLYKFFWHLYLRIVFFEPKQLSFLLRYLPKVDLQRYFPPKADNPQDERKRRLLIAKNSSIFVLGLSSFMTVVGYPYFADQVKVIEKSDSYFYLPDHYADNHIPPLRNYELYDNSELSLTFNENLQPYEKDLAITLPRTFDPQKLPLRYSKVNYLPNPLDFSSFEEGDFSPNLRPENIPYAPDNEEKLPENYVYCGNFSFEVLALSLKKRLAPHIYKKSQVLPYKDSFYIKIGPFFKRDEAKVLASTLRLNQYTPSCLVAIY
jgi:hypothetical protein